MGVNRDNWHDNSQGNRNAFLSGLLVLACCLLLLDGANARPRHSCDQDRVCIQTDESAFDVHLYLVNKGNVPVAITISTRTRNLQSPVESTILQTVPAGKRILAASYRAIDRQSDIQFRYSYKWAVGDHRAQHDDSYVYRLPYASDHRYRVLQTFGSSFSHKGREQYAVDFNMTVGTAVHAARGGVVANVEASHTRGCWEKGCGKYANFIVILHSDGTTGEYYHLKQRGVVVDSGDQVKRGELIGYSGNTGHTTMPHLHFAVYRPVEWGRTQSLPFRFKDTDGVIEQLRRGGRYRAE
jgi:murein DD-endopeptidase MepM/ murein hydrolase activator NlpD